MAQRVGALAQDVAELLPAFAAEIQAGLNRQPEFASSEESAKPGRAGRNGAMRVVFHVPCTLQYGQKIHGAVEALLAALGAEVLPCGESHLCCGSAGTYSVLQPELSARLRDLKLANLHQPQPDAILSANIGCITHLQSGTDTPVMHWIEPKNLS